MCYSRLLEHAESESFQRRQKTVSGNRKVKGTVESQQAGRVWSPKRETGQTPQKPEVKN